MKLEMLYSPPNLLDGIEQHISFISESRNFIHRGHYMMIEFEDLGKVSTPGIPDRDLDPLVKLPKCQVSKLLQTFISTLTLFCKAHQEV